MFHFGDVPESGSAEGNEQICAGSTVAFVLTMAVNPGISENFHTG